MNGNYRDSVIYKRLTTALNHLGDSNDTFSILLLLQLYNYKLKKKSVI